MDIKGFKKFIHAFFVSVLLLAFLLPYVGEDIYLAATNANTGLSDKGAIVRAQTTAKPVIPMVNGTTARVPVEETTRKKPHGHAVENAEYHDELWEKYSVIAAEDGGGNGEGGGASAKHSAIIGNRGNYDEIGGVFGGQGGNLPGQGGFGGSGSATADELRKMKADIDASRAASLAREIEDKMNKKAVEESIKESESIAMSIQKKLQQEAVKKRLQDSARQRVDYVNETHIEYKDMPDVPNLPEISIDMRRIVTEETYVAMPTAAPTTARPVENRVGIAIKNKDDLKAPDAIEMIKGFVTNYEELPINAPTAEATVENSVAPPEDAPVVPIIPETIVYDAPIIEEAIPQEPIIDKKEPSDEIETTVKESEDIDEKMDEENEKESEVQETLENEGSNGGENPEEEVDKEGDAENDEKSGDADDKGLLHFEKKEDEKGKKIFELDTTGNIGLNPEIISLSSTKTIAILVSLFFFIVGSIVYLLRQRDKRDKKNYF